MTRNNILSVLFLIIGIQFGFAVNCYSQTKTVSIDVKNKPLKEVFQIIENNSDYIFLYNPETLDENSIVSVSANKETVTSVLDKLFTKTDNTYKISGRQIYISRTDKQVSPSEASAKIPKKKTIRGIILDQKGQTVIGAGIIEVGTNNGVSTGLDGEFIIEVAP